MSTLNGTNGEDTITGTSSNDTINSGNGDDTVDGGAGNDTINAGNGDDTVDGGSGNDTIDGGNGDDTIYGGSGNDTLLGGRGNDFLLGEEGNDLLQGGQGNDYIEGNEGADIVKGEEGDDKLVYTLDTVGVTDIYDGGKNNDTLVLRLTLAQQNEFASQIDAFRQFLALNANAGSSTGPVFTFDFGNNTLLKVSNVENLKIETINVNNSAPNAADDTITADEDSLILIDPATLLANDTDPDNDNLIIEGVGNALNGVAILLTSGPDAGKIQFTPNANFNGIAGFDYLISDGQGHTDLAHVTVNVTPVNDPPEAVDDDATLNEDASIIINVLANDTDLDGDILSVLSVGPAEHGLAILNADNTITYTANANYNGADSFSYTIKDSSGATSSAIVSLTINAQNDPPVAVNDSAALNEDASITINVLSNDTDLDGDMLSVLSVGAAEHGMAVLNADNTITYTPNANYNGADSFSYTIKDSSGATSSAIVSLTINAQNDPPVAVNDAAALNEDASITINVLANDTDLDGDILSVLSVGAAEHGMALLNIDNNTITYTPNANYNGQDSFTYTISDGKGGTSSAVVSLTIDAANDPPVAVDDIADLAEDSNIIIDVLANDTDIDGDTLSSILVSGPSNGTLTLNPDGSFTYIPNENYNGTDSFTYKANDGLADSSVATVNITIHAVNDPPVAVNDGSAEAPSLILSEGQFGIIPVLENDIDPEMDDLSVDLNSIQFIDREGLNGHVHGSIGSSGDDLFYDTQNNRGGDIFDYLGEGDYVIDEFTYQILDDTGLISNAAHVYVKISGVNDPATIDGNAEGAVKEDDLILTSGKLNVQDVDSGEAKFFAETDVLSDNGYGYFSIDADGNWSYSLNNSLLEIQQLPEGETKTDTHHFYSFDESASQQVTITITGTNDAASITGTSTGDVKEDQVLTASGTLTVLDNDLGQAQFIEQSNVVSDNGYGNFSIDANGNWNYLLNNNLLAIQQLAEGTILTDTHQFTSFDGTDSQEVIITINGTNDDPVANNDTKTLNEDEIISINVLGNDTNLDGDMLSVLSIGAAEHGMTVLNADNTITYTPHTNYNGADSFSYTIQDSSGATSSATVSLTIDPVNDPPVALDDGVYSVNEGETLSINALLGVLINDTDAENQSLNAILVDGPLHAASFILNPDGSFVYTPNPNYTGLDNFTYKAFDGLAYSILAANVNINITENNLPLLFNDQDNIVDFSLFGQNALNSYDQSSIYNAAGGNDTVYLPFNLSSATAIGYDLSHPFDGGEGNDTIKGSSDNDIIIGNNGNDIFLGSYGNDNLSGDEGQDTISFNNLIDTFFFNLQVNLDNEVVTFTTGIEYTYILSSIENIIGSPLPDTISGDENDNVLDPGYMGSYTFDILDGGLGNDTISFANSIIDTFAYFSGINITLDPFANIAFFNNINEIQFFNFENVIGSPLNDRIYGDSNNNIIEGGLGNDNLSGNSVLDISFNNDHFDHDTVSYVSASSGVNISLMSNFGSGGAGNDTLAGFENITGSAFNDILSGDMNNNTILGGSGNDLLMGNLGVNIINGGLGIDTVRYNFFVFGIDQIIIDLSTGHTETSPPFPLTIYDTLIDIENVIGSPQNDIITGDSNDNVIDPGTGFLNILDGGFGMDTLSFDSLLLGGTTGFNVDFGNGYASNNAINVQFFNFENVKGSTLDDIIIGDGGNNIIEGGRGNDTLSGGGGSDIFVYSNMLDRGTGNEHIMDFNQAEMDMLNLKLVNDFPMYDGTNAFTAGFVALDTISNSGSTVVKIDIDGVFGTRDLQTLVTVDNDILTEQDILI